MLWYLVMLLKENVDPKIHTLLHEEEQQQPDFRYISKDKLLSLLLWHKIVLVVRSSFGL